MDKNYEFMDYRDGKFTVEIVDEETDSEIKTIRVKIPKALYKPYSDSDQK